MVTHCVALQPAATPRSRVSTVRMMLAVGLMFGLVSAEPSLLALSQCGLSACVPAVGMLLISLSRWFDIFCRMYGTICRIQADSTRFFLAFLCSCLGVVAGWGGCFRLALAALGLAWCVVLRFRGAA